MKRYLPSAALTLLLIAPPLIGGWIAGEPLGHYFHFPTTGEALAERPFSPLCFSLLAAGIAATLLFAGLMAFARPAKNEASPAPERHPFPAWGWAGVALTAAAWAIAWLEIPALEAPRRFTFAPLWLGYILTVNALTARRTGHCLMLDRPGYFATLFPASALMWWYFEFLNRFTLNWYYTGLPELSAFGYYLWASIAFATVLPAVLSTRQWLASHPRLVAHLNRGRPIPRPPAEATAVLLLGGGLFLLVGFGPWPQALYPALWLAPLMLLTAWRLLGGRQSVFSDIARGDWSRVIIAALAGLLCGFFLELWNGGSLAQWHHHLPEIDRWRLFGMPLLGWAGYLPFGVLCLAVGDLLTDPWRKMPKRPKGKRKPFPIKVVTK